MVAQENHMHHIPGYTGFLPGGQHQMAKTYGQASEATLSERQANADPLKWRKFVSYTEFTPPHTPAEEHHIPGYSGHVPSVYAENLYAKTYGKTTLQAIKGEFFRGCVQTPAEQYKTATEETMPQQAAHPGKPKDIMPGGSSWTGASPYNVVDPNEQKELEPVNPWPPSTVQIAGGKEPPQMSPLLKNLPPSNATTEPAIVIAGKEDAHDPIDPAKRTMSVTKGDFHIPGYGGFVPGMQSENVFGSTYAGITAKADKIRHRKTEGASYLSFDRTNDEGIVPLYAPEDARSAEARAARKTSGDMPTTKVDGPQPHAKHVPGYTGFVPGVQSENIYSRTYGHATQVAIAGDHERFQWREERPETRFRTSQREEMLNFGHPAKIQDGHVTYAHERTNPARATYSKTRPALLSSKGHVPGYGGFVPGIQSRNVFGENNMNATSSAMQQQLESWKSYEARKPNTAPPPTNIPEIGMLQFKPNGFLYQKRMQGEWNNGMLGSRNYSAVKLSEGNIWKGNHADLYRTTTNSTHTGHESSAAPKVFSKGPEPKFMNMDHALKHKSTYLGFYAL